MSATFTFTITDDADAERLEKDLRQVARIYTRDERGNVKDGRFDISAITVTRAIEPV